MVAKGRQQSRRYDLFLGENYRVKKAFCMINFRPFYIAFAAIIVLSVAGCSGSVMDNLPTYEQSSIVKVGDMAPLFSATLIDGGEVSLEEYRGEPMMLILFSHTCADCKAFFDDLQQLIDGDAAQPSILAIGRDATAEELQGFRADNGYTIDMVSDAKRAIFRLYATAYVPRVYVIDASGRVAMFRVEYKPHYLTELMECINGLNE